jgi:RNA recognition motif-containing protein
VRLSTEADGTPRGFGYVTFAASEGVKKAIQLAGYMLKGRPIRVDFDYPGSNKAADGGEAGGGGGGGGGEGFGGSGGEGAYRSGGSDGW